MHCPYCKHEISENANFCEQWWEKNSQVSYLWTYHLEKRKFLSHGRNPFAVEIFC